MDAVRKIKMWVITGNVDEETLEHDQQELKHKPYSMKRGLFSPYPAPTGFVNRLVQVANRTTDWKRGVVLSY